MHITALNAITALCSSTDCQAMKVPTNYCFLNNGFQAKTMGKLPEQTRKINAKLKAFFFN